MVCDEELLGLLVNLLDQASDLLLRVVIVSLGTVLLQHNLHGFVLQGLQLRLLLRRLPTARLEEKLLVLHSIEGGAPVVVLGDKGRSLLEVLESLHELVVGQLHVPADHLLLVLERMPLVCKLSVIIVLDRIRMDVQ